VENDITSPVGVVMTTPAASSLASNETTELVEELLVSSTSGLFRTCRTSVVTSTDPQEGQKNQLL